LAYQQLFLRVRIKVAAAAVAQLQEMQILDKTDNPEDSFLEELADFLQVLL
jgi:hypothetical protein